MYYLKYNDELGMFQWVETEVGMKEMMSDADLQKAIVDIHVLWKESPAGSEMSGKLMKQMNDLMAVQIARAKIVDMKGGIDFDQKTNDQAQAWIKTFESCVDLGMKIDGNGVDSVVKFIHYLKAKADAYAAAIEHPKADPSYEKAWDEVVELCKKMGMPLGSHTIKDCVLNFIRASAKNVPKNEKILRATNGDEFMVRRRDGTPINEKFYVLVLTHRPGWDPILVDAARHAATTYAAIVRHTHPEKRKFVLDLLNS